MAFPTALTYTRNSINTFTIPLSKDPSGTPQTSANTTWYFTITNYDTGASVVASTQMSYSGTPGSWTFDIPASAWTAPAATPTVYPRLYLVALEYDQNGSVGLPRLQQDYICTDGG